MPPEELDMNIEGESDDDAGEERPAPRRKSPRKKAATRKRTVARKSPARKRAAPVYSTPDDDEDEVEVPAFMRPRIAIDTATSSPKRVNLYRRLSLSFLAATIGVIGVIAFFTFQRANITIAQESIPVAATFGVEISEHVATSTPQAANLFPGMVMTVTTSTERMFQPTATSEKPGTARGVVTIYNNGGAAQSLVATTRFLSENGVLFRAVKAVNIPARGTAQVEIAADKPGPEGDIGPSKFTIPGLDAARQKLVYGETTKPMTGGSTKVGVVSQADIDRAQEETRKALLEIGQQALSSVKIPQGMELRYATVNIKPESSVKAGEQVGEFKMAVSGTMAFVAYSKNQIYAAADREVQHKSPTPYHKVVFVNEAPAVSLQSISIENKTATLQIYREGRAVLDPKSAAFQPQQFLGRSKQEVVDQLKTIRGIKQVDVQLFPFWVDRAPKVPSRIDVKIKDAQ